jgi:hypothetical protein
VVVPHPVLVTEDSVEAAKVNVGTVTLRMSFVCRGVFDVNEKVMVVGAEVTGLLMLSEVYVSAGGTTAVELGIAKAAVSGTPASVADTTRVAKFAACAVEDVVIPDPTATVHIVLATSVAVPAVKISAAVLLPVFSAVIVNEVERHPLVLCENDPPNEKPGTTTLIESPLSKETLSENCITIEVTELVTGLSIFNCSRVNVAVGAEISVEEAMDVVAMLEALRNATADV